MMASDGEDITTTPTESIASVTDTEDEEASAHIQSDLESEVEDPDVEEVPASSEDADMEELMRQLEDYTPTIPDALTMHTLRTAGFSTVDPKIVRLISVSAQKFISDIANDALQHCKTRTTNIQHSSGHSSNKKNPKDRKYTLAMEDLVPALADHGITMRKPQYFV
ncbi:transcription initiation factor TFIID subunit 10 [Drosophila bipectinata]|uniref:transcription initiation factor TFIID subunit 10 n=1 Tax=Drosophila bipectinata TaxID=42026 RepID=UPI0007E64C0D|nr:transcription initiation factor TFIID subunit 10 [Drosophila bipectinata]XP_017099445.1 transcription initiation factor TFIID subunit 10 [Drosophila bipectinata]